jgi:2-polyprenyl-3-methyl-5-hydroxy-6-metoxy-1,4-benzoquinol methylase
MEYDPIKRRLGRVFKRNMPLLRLFYFALDLLFLRTWYIHKEIKKFIKNRNSNKDFSVLDAGSGFGQYSWYIARKYKNAKLKGIDIKEQEILECQTFFKKANLNNVKFEVQNLLSFKEEDSFDLILSVDVLEHIEDDIAVMKNAYDSLKSKGILLISTPSDQGGSGIKHDDDESFISEHVRDGYSIIDISKKLKIAGFSNITADYSYGFAGSLSWRYSVKYPAILLNASKWFFLLLPVYYLIVYPACFWLNIIDLNVENTKGTGLIVVAEKD